MKRLFLNFLLLVSALGFTTVAGASDRWETLRAINWVENPTNQTQVGRFGELGPYQFRPATWRMHTDKPFRQAIQREAADEVAVKHYEWIKRTFEQAGVAPSVFNIAMAWNCGVDAVVTGRAPTVSYGYAERVSNLVETMKERVRPGVPAPSRRGDDLNPAEQGDSGVRFRVLQDTPRFVLAAS
jgi:ABC-type glycerol-3-phosphate transport system substrate-binding protein